MKTVLILEPDVEALVLASMRSRGVSLNEAVNSALRVGLSGPPPAAPTPPAPAKPLGEAGS